MSRHRRGVVSVDAVSGALAARRRLWLQQHGTKVWLERTIAILRVREGVDRWEDDGGPCR